jgi:hypothetical protein
MPYYLVRKTETYHYLLEADSKEDAEQQAEDLPEHDWDQSDGPLIEVELAEAEQPGDCGGNRD